MKKNQENELDARGKGGKKENKIRRTGRTWEFSREKKIRETDPHLASQHDKVRETDPDLVSHHNAEKKAKKRMDWIQDNGIWKKNHEKDPDTPPNTLEEDPDIPRNKRAEETTIIPPRKRLRKKNNA